MFSFHELLTSPLFIASAVLGFIGAITILSGLWALVTLRPLRFLTRSLVGFVLLTLSGITGAVAVGVQGYRALTREEVAARLWVRPTAPQRFAATMRDPDGREQTFELAGDEIYVDAHILKWQPILNMLGLHTSYELSRIGGRYRTIGQERSEARTVHSLEAAKPVDLFDIRQRYTFLAPLVDAEYGSATFVPVTQPAELEVRVSTTGLMIRPLNLAPKS